MEINKASGAILLRAAAEHRNQALNILRKDRSDETMQHLDWAIRINTVMICTVIEEERI